jgi:hypothetical protein
MKILIELEKMVEHYYALAFLEADDERNLYNEYLVDALSYLNQSVGQRDAVRKTRQILANAL